MAKRDYSEVLGVAREASEADIQKLPSLDGVERGDPGPDGHQQAAAVGNTYQALVSSHRPALTSA